MQAQKEDPRVEVVNEAGGGETRRTSSPLKDQDDCQKAKKAEIGAQTRAVLEKEIGAVTVTGTVIAGPPVSDG